MKPHKEPRSHPPTSWEPVQNWYKEAVGKEGHHYHQEIILPRLQGLIKTHAPNCKSLLDLACGQGVLARALPRGWRYTGVDISPSLIAFAKKHDTHPSHRYLVGDITNPKLELGSTLFDCATVILALQNIENPQAVFVNAARSLENNGTLVLVLNHPCFRVPRQSHWQIDEQKKCRFRRLESYMSPLKIPIQAHPSQGKDSPVTWSFHHPLEAYSKWLFEAGFVIEVMQEWCSTKQSYGKTAKMENRSRQEFPLFMALVARKKEGTTDAQDTKADRPA